MTILFVVLVCGLVVPISLEFGSNLVANWKFMEAWSLSPVVIMDGGGNSELFFLFFCFWGVFGSLGGLLHVITIIIILLLLF